MEEKNPQISVIVPVYNVEEYLHRCINSILSQTFRDLELILVDDGSPDNSGAICDEYEEKDYRVRVIHKTNGGVSSARNIGLLEANCEWLYFVDSDDWIAPNTLELLIKKSKESFYDLIIHGLIDDYINKNYSNIITYDKIDEIDYSSIIERADKWGLLKGPVCKLFRRSIVESNNILFDTSICYGEDTKFSFQYLQCCNSVGFIPYHLYHYCYRDSDSLTKIKYTFDFWINTAKMLKSVRIPICDKFMMSDSYVNYIDQVYFDHILYAINSLYQGNDYPRGVRIKYISSINRKSFEKYKPNLIYHKLYLQMLKFPWLVDIITPLIQ